MKLLVGLLTCNNLLTFMTDNKDNIHIHIIHKDTQTHIEADKHIDRQTDKQTDGRTGCVMIIQMCALPILSRMI